MKAIVYEEFGPPDVLRLKEIETPTPGDHDVLVKVHATTVNYGDIVARNFREVSPRDFNMPFLFWIIARFSFGLNKPNTTILGSEFSGEIAATGKAVTRFREGDQVFGYLGQGMGAYAEFICMSEDGVLAAKPANMTYEEAAAVPYGAMTALSLLGKANIQPGQKVLINGASGSIGSAAVQLARNNGAEVTGVCGTPRVKFVEALGAHKVIDYTKEDFTRNGETYDLIFDVLGKSSFARCKDSLSPDGIYLLASFKMKKLLEMLWTSVTSRKKVICALAPESLEDLTAVKTLVEEGKIKAIIDRCFPMAQAAEAHRYVESGQKAGHVVITIAQDGNGHHASGTS